VNHSFHLRRVDIDFDREDQVDFHMPLWGFAQNQDFLLKRKRAAGVSSSIVKEFLVDKGPRPTIILAGSKGIGKSCESLFMVKALVDSDQGVIFEHGTERMLIVTQKALNLNRQDLDEVFASYEEPYLERAGVYTFESHSETFFRALCKGTSFVHIVDIGDNYKGTIDVEHSQIIISSPNSKTLKRSGELKPLMRYLDPWTRDELEHLNQCLPSSTQGHHLLVRKSPEDVKELYNMFGGIPREVFANRTMREAAELIKREVGNVALDVWENVLTEPDYTRLPKMVPGVLVHITRAEGNLCDVSFASKYVAKVVVRKFYRSQRNKLFALANSVKGEKRLTAQLRGEMLQQRMHEVLEHPCELSITPLLNNGVRGTSRVLQVPRLTMKEFESNKLLDLQSLAENDYCVALSSNFPSVESFFIIKRRLLGIDEDGLCVVGLQATTASTHPVKRKGLKDIIKRCCELLKSTLPLYVIFVTTPNGIQVRQSLGKRPERFDDTVLQFACTDVDFNEILKALPGVSRSDDDSEEEEEESE